MYLTEVTQKQLGIKKEEKKKRIIDPKNMDIIGACSCEEPS